MSVATEPKRTVTQEVEPASALDQAIAATAPRVQSIRADAAKFLGVPPDKVCDLLRNVWHTSKDQPELTNSEMFVGMSMIARFGLDPIAKEVYVTRTSKGLMTIIGIDGFVKILHRSEGYNGFEQELGWNATGDDLEWVETRIHHKSQKFPTVYRAFTKEYSRLAGMLAKHIPWHMLRLFSLRHAIRLFTPLGGAVTEEEARWMREYDPRDAKPSNAAAAVADDFAKELGKAKQPKPEPAPEPKEAPESETTEQQATDLFGGEQGDAEPDPVAVYAQEFADTLKSAENVRDCMTAWDVMLQAGPTEAQRVACKRVLVATVAGLAQGGRKAK